MPVFLSALLGTLVQGMGSLVGRVLISLGLSYVLFKGMDASIEWARDQALVQLQGLSADVVLMAGKLQIGTAVNILTSAMLGRLVVDGLTGGALKRLVLK